MIISDNNEDNDDTGDQLILLLTFILGFQPMIRQEC
jgi:hypothetical protein